MAKKPSKRREALLKIVDATKTYSVDEAMATLKNLKSAKFDETVEVALNLNVDPRHADQMVRGSVVLPNGTGKTVRVAVFAKDAKADEAKAAGADLVGSTDLIESIQAGNIDFDIVISTPDMMGVLGKVARILGPKGLMPNPKTGTVTPDVVGAIQKAKAGQVRFRADKAGIIHASVGTVAFDADKLKQNINALMEDLVKAKPASAKGTYVKKVTISSTMGPGLVVDQSSL